MLIITNTAKRAANIIDAIQRTPALNTSELFYITDKPSLEGADSIELLRRTVAAVTAEGWRVGNADCSVVCDAPRLAPMRDAMQQRLSTAVGAPVTVKGRRPEGLGALGRGEGIVCLASAVIVRSAP